MTCSSPAASCGDDVSGMLHDVAGEPAVSLVGASAILFEARGPQDLEQQSRIWGLARLTERWPGVEEAVPGMTNLLLVLDRPPAEPGSMAQSLLRAWADIPARFGGGRHHVVDVFYGGEHAIDLPAVAARAGLAPAEVVRIHAAGEYAVFALGSAPGFAYLGGLDPRIFMPRKRVPSLCMVRGSVTIGGMQTGVAASTGPNGWNAIGHADLDVFDVSRDSPALLSPGDTVRFRIAGLSL